MSLDCESYILVKEYIGIRSSNFYSGCCLSKAGDNTNATNTNCIGIEDGIRT